MLVETEDQSLMRESVRRFAQDKMPISQLRRLRDANDPVGFDRAAWSGFAEMGWTGLLVPEEFDGVDFGHVGAAILCEELGRTLAASPFLSTSLMAATAIRHGGSQLQKEKFLPLLARGSIIAFAIDEASKHRPAEIDATAARTGTLYRLDGTKTFVADAAGAASIVVVARVGSAFDCETGFFVVNAGAPGLSMVHKAMVDGRVMSTIRLDDVSVPLDCRLEGGENGQALLTRVLDAGRLGLSAELLGIAAEAFHRTIGYLRQRRQFGRTIGSFQALQHRMAHLFCEIEIARSAVLAAAQAQDSSAPDSEMLTSIAKSKAAQLARLSTAEAVQMHGGIGVTDEFDIGFFMKRARVASEHLGDAEFHNDRVARLLGI